MMMLPFLMMSKRADMDHVTSKLFINKFLSNKYGSCISFDGLHDAYCRVLNAQRSCSGGNFVTL